MPSDLFRIAVTCVICKVGPKGERKYLILKRSPKEVHGNSMWTVAGGTVEEQDWKGVKYFYDFPLWYDVGIRALKREVKEETGLELLNPKFLCDCVFIHTTGVPEIVLSYYATVFNGHVRISEEHTDYEWVKVDELPKYNLLIDIPMEIKKVDAMIDIVIEDIINRR